MKILIWGTGRLSWRYMKFEVFQEHEIVGFIDSYKREEHFRGYPVYSPEEISCLKFDSIVVCVKKYNDEILETCVENGINLGKVFFAEIDIGFKEENQKYEKKLMTLEEASHNFPLIFKEKEETKLRDSYYENQLILSKGMKERALIDEIEENFNITWIPIELLFSEKKTDNHPVNYTDEWLQQNSVWENLPLIAFRPYRNLLNFFSNGTQFPGEYCSWHQNLFKSRCVDSCLPDEMLIDRRYREYRTMQQELNKGMQFFIDHPAVAKWNKRGYFNLIDGHHRVSFLYHMGITRIPVRITKRDYKIWCNKNIAETVYQIILKQKRVTFYQPILNPYFMGINSYRETSTKSRLHHILEFFSEKRFVGKKVIDIGANLGYMGQAFYRMGAEVTLLEPDVIHYELTRKINELLYTNCKLITQKFEDYDAEEEYDIAILLTVFYHYFHKDEIREKFIRKLNECVSQMVIWESGDEYEREKEFILKNTKFKNYKHLCYTYATGKFRELGIFMADESEFL